MLRTILLLLVSLCVIPSGKAAPADDLSKQKDAPSASPWIVKTYRFSDASNFQPKDQDPLGGPPRTSVEPPMAPAPQAPEKEVNEFIRKSDLVLQKYFTEMGYPPPPGSLFVFDPKSFTLVARTTASVHVLIQALSEHWSAPRTDMLNCSMEILEADAAIIRNELKLMAPNEDHSASFERLSALADQGKAKRISALTMHTRNGQRAKLSRTTSHPFSTGFTVQQNGNLTTEQERYENGTTLELDPVLDINHNKTDLTFALEHDFAAPSERIMRTSARVNNLSLSSQVTDLHNVKICTSDAFLNGRHHLLGIWKPETSIAAAAPTDLLQAGFLRIDSQKVGPLENTQLRAWLTTIGESIVPTPNVAPIEPNAVPKGMTIRVFHEPVGFLEKNSDNHAEADSEAKNSPPSPKPTAMEILTSLGANFPKGASATYNEKHQLLIVRNTPENLKYLEVMGLKSSGSSNLSLTAHIVQADGAFIRKLQQESRSITDHSMVWQLAGDAVNKKQATILRTVWLGTRNGQRAKTEFGHEVAEVEVEFSKTITETLHGLKAEQDVAPENETKPDATKSTQPSNANAGIHTAAPRPLRGNHFNQRVGTSIEVDPIIGEDGRTIEMNLSMTYDYAMPTELPAAAPATEKNLQLEVNGHEFHRMNMNQAITMESGTWKMLNLWKPEGTAEFDGKDILQALFIRADIVRNEAKE